mmetsp:Transcript_57595/g.140673  ORF Transcript_57595/g.140673 Transcript_57595/m.140673 type:complete len:438 (+) Transcript_57595:74-1387(+)
MCGRAAQSSSSIDQATDEFGAVAEDTQQQGSSRNRNRQRNRQPQPQHDTQHNDASHRKSSSSSSSPTETESHWNDNFNLSPGMDCAVIYLDRGNDNEYATASPATKQNLRVEEMKWGLITKNGTTAKPLYENDKDIMKMCFQRLCYNARSDTLYEKPTFANLTNRRRSCVVAFDGYFEWKTTLAKLGKKQPYFLYRRQGQEQQEEQAHDHRRRRRQPLLMAGLWTRVKTGRDDEPTMYSFTILTTEANDQISWLHHRMPICIWDHDLAIQWLQDPSPNIMKRLDDDARQKKNGFSWHKTNPEMTSLKYRSPDAICEYKDPTRSVKAFFKVQKGEKTEIQDNKTSPVKESTSTNCTTETTSAKQQPHDKQQPKAETQSKKHPFAKNEVTPFPPPVKKFKPDPSNSHPPKHPSKTASSSSNKKSPAKQKSIRNFFTPKS